MGNHFIQFNIAPSEKNMVLKAARLFRKLRADTYGDLLPTMIIATAQTLGLRKLGWNFLMMKIFWLFSCEPEN